MPASKPTEKKQAESFSNFSTFTRGGDVLAPPASISLAPSYSSFSSSTTPSIADMYDVDDAIESFRTCSPGGKDTKGFIVVVVFVVVALFVSSTINFGGTNSRLFCTRFICVVAPGGLNGGSANSEAGKLGCGVVCVES